MSDGNFKAMNNFLTSNFEKIYSAPKIRTYEETIKIQIKAIFDAFMDASNDIEKAYQTITKLSLSLKIFFLFRHIHYIAQSSHGSGYNSNLLNRL